MATANRGNVSKQLKNPSDKCGTPSILCLNIILRMCSEVKVKKRMVFKMILFSLGKTACSTTILVTILDYPSSSATAHSSRTATLPSSVANERSRLHELQASF